MKERELLEELARGMPRSPDQLGGMFQSDAEILRWGGEYLLFSTDEFSAEDLFCLEDPYALGRNIACAAASDILASGGVPLYYAHSLTVDGRFDMDYTRRFYEGVGDVLREAGIGFIGGDFGRADRWRCCASVIGRTQKPVLRSGAISGDRIYLTGPVGAGNIQAALSLLPIALEEIPSFTLRTEALETVAKHATSCIDTSDGLFQAVRTIARMSNVGFSLEDVPYLPLGRAVTRQAGLPLEMLVFCECGEYELLFTSPEKGLPFPCIGRITQEGMTLEGKDVGHVEFSARSHGDLGAYLEEVKRVCEGL